MRNSYPFSLSIRFSSSAVSIAFFPNLQVQVIGKESVKLYAGQSPFCKKCPSLLYLSHKMKRCIFLRENNCFATESANFCSSDIEHIAVFRHIIERHIRILCSQCIPEPGSVQIKRKPVFTAYRRQFCQFSFCIQSAILCRMRNIDHSRNTICSWLSSP